ncbi:MAG: CoA transferase [Acidimicrobiales bacterium]
MARRQETTTRTSLSPTVPQLAIETCAGRLAPLDGLPPLDHAITWFGPGGCGPGSPLGSEDVIQAMCGLMAVNGRDAGGPRRIGLDVASVAAGLLAAHGAIAAEIARRRDGTSPVPVVRTSVLQAGLLLMSNYFVVATALGDALPGPPLPAPGPPFRSADGRWFEIETLDPDPWKEFWGRLGVGAVEAGRGWRVFQWRYERATCSCPPELHAAAATKPLADLHHLAAATGVSLVALRDEPDVRPDESEPSVRQAGRAPRPEMGGAPGDLPLNGIRMVEATSRIQGPLAGMLLRMLGADVVRIQPPEGDYGRAALCLHRAKETVRLDLGTRSGRAQLVELIDGADVFLHNWRPGKAAQWGLAFDDLAPQHPHLVYAHTSGWGDRPEARDLIGTDFLVQAHVGMGHLLAGPGEPPFPSRIVLCDLFGALVGAEGILTGLYRREQAGGAWEVRSSLLAGAMALMTHGRRRDFVLEPPAPAADLADNLAADLAADLAAIAHDPRFAGLFEPVGAGLAPRSPWTFAR